MGPGTAGATDGVALRTLVVGTMPLLVASAGELGRAADLREALVEAGLVRLERFLGIELPKGAKVGFVVSGEELRLLDERENVLLRAARDGLAEDWREVAARVRGTLFVVARDVDLRPEIAPSQLAAALDEEASGGEAPVLGAIVGVVEERPTLPLLLT